MKNKQLSREAEEAWANAMMARGRNPNRFWRSRLDYLAYKLSFGKNTPRVWRVKKGEVCANSPLK